VQMYLHMSIHLHLRHARGSYAAIADADRLPPEPIVLRTGIGQRATMDRAYVSGSATELSRLSDAEVFGQLAARLPFAVEPLQRAAWEFQIQDLRRLTMELPAAHFFLEFLIPRMGRRADLIVLQAGIVFVVEYKLGARQYDRSSLD